MIRIFSFIKPCVCIFVVCPKVGIENKLVFKTENLIIGVCGLLGFDGLMLHYFYFHIVYFALIAQTERIKNEIAYFVVFVNHENKLCEIIAFGPFTGKNVVLGFYKVAVVENFRPHD